jgi:hypothetical protein
VTDSTIHRSALDPNANSYSQRASFSCAGETIPDRLDAIVVASRVVRCLVVLIQSTHGLKHRGIAEPLAGPNGRIERQVTRPKRGPAPDKHRDNKDQHYSRHLSGPL